MRRTATSDPRVDRFTEFVHQHEKALRESLVAACGDVGRDAAADALMYGWEHWDRVSKMENPVGYLYKVGLSRAWKAFSRRRPMYHPVEPFRMPDVEPRLPVILARLSERQRTVVVLIHCFGWSQSEVGAILGLSKTTVQNHLERGMSALRRDIGGVP